MRTINVDAIFNKFDCPKHDVTMVSGSQEAEHTCTDYSGSNVPSFCSRWGRHDTLLLLTVIMEILV